MTTRWTKNEDGSFDVSVGDVLVGTVSQTSNMKWRVTKSTHFRDTELEDERFDDFVRAGRALAKAFERFLSAPSLQQSFFIPDLFV